MLSKGTVKFVRSLSHLKYRQKYHKLVVEGVRSVCEILRDKLLSVDRIYIVGEIPESMSGYVQEVPREHITTDQMRSLSAFKSPSQVLAICEMPKQTAKKEIALTGLCLYLDGIRDPGNLGTIFRIADWFGMDAVFMSEDCADPFNPKVIQASMTSVFRVPMAAEPLEAFSGMTGLNIYAASLQGSSVFDLPLKPSGMIILGNEGAGIRQIPQVLDVHHVSIPVTHSRGAESLNVAVAAGIICSAFRLRSTK